MAQVLPFNGFYKGSSEKNSSRECVNYIPVRHDSGSLSEYTLETTVGIRESIDNTGSYKIGRSLKWLISYGESSLGAVVPIYGGGKFKILVTYDGRLKQEFDILTEAASNNSALAISASNNNKLVFVCAHDTGSTIVSVAPSMGVEATGTPPTGVAFGDMAYIGDRFIYMAVEDNAASNPIKVFYSDILDPTVVDALSFFSDLSQTSQSKGIHVLDNRVYLFSENGYSVWSNSPNVNLPFIMQKGSGGSVGLLNTNAKTEVGGVLYFIGVRNGASSLYSLSSGGLSYLGNEFIDRTISRYSRATVFSFKHNGIDIVCINGEETFCYDVVSGEYHKRTTYDKNLQEEVKWAIDDSEIIEGENIVFGSPYLSFDSLIVSQFYKTIGTELGVNVNRHLVTSPFNSDGVTNNVRELAFQTDIDYSSLTPATLPDLSLSVSENFGRTFEAERLEAFDADGENTKILRYMNIGFFRQAFVFKLKTNNIYPHKILKMMTRLEKGFRQI